jgi:hypothetical protein
MLKFWSMRRTSHTAGYFHFPELMEIFLWENNSINIYCIQSVFFYHKIRFCLLCVDFRHLVLYFIFKQGVGIVQSLWRQATGWTAGVRFTTFRPTQPPMQRVPAALSLWVMRQEREDDHSPPSSTEVKNDRATPPLLHITSWHSG